MKTLDISSIGLKSKENSHGVVAEIVLGQSKVNAGVKL